ncbi:ABC-type branched-subunit amino acid transport system substrate-binding protein [Actinocorallia herbida]|uniref:ABC-type branched-subunit amino acid transport system substrate-binding protein n=1 Tax=Actinocorallia herbida TaxID=58109 RepID=A0A3N1CYY0_9ACTN|nr:ABC transporter substrate-binding protein [Actinocorallia herbida]ROO86465.1 ABC-type branched-subunit amino acid transport system substrate-binding protein [Actinocorallia herbida]
MTTMRLAAVGAAAALLLAGCGTGASEETEAAAGGVVTAEDCLDPAAAEAAISGTLKVGWSAPLSGPLAAAAGAVIDGMKARFAVANAAGGIGGVKLEVVAKDDAFNPERAKANVNELIQKDGVHVLEVFGSGQLNAAADDQNEACVPLLYAQAAVPEYRDAANFPWTTEYLPSSEVEMAVVVAQLQQKYPDGVKVALAANQTESGQSYANGFKKAIEGTNVTIAAEAPLTDPNAAVTTLKESGAPVLIDAGVTTDCLALSMAVGRSGWKPETFVQPANCVDGKSLYEPAGAAADGQQVMVWLKDPANPIYADDAGVKQYLTDAAAQGVKAPLNNYTVNGWAIGDLMVDAFTKAAASEDGLSRLGIIKVARTQTYSPPMFIDGIDWKMTPETSLGIGAFRPFTWSAAKKAFEPAGDVITIDGH